MQNPIVDKSVARVKDALKDVWDGLSSADQTLIEDSVRDAAEITLQAASSTDVQLSLEVAQVNAQLSAIASIAASRTRTVVWEEVLNVLKDALALTAEAVLKNNF